ncbi:MAG: ROK family transcriptional regulator [Clostridia bacterium]|nr:ROK family transcriptional regulator [Clostridia bacterium]
MNPAILNEKVNNTKRILELIIQNGSISRPSLATLTGLSPATITNLTLNLLNKKIIVERGKDESTLGRKANLLEFNNKYAYIVGVRPSPYFPTDLYISDLMGNVIDKQSIKINLKVDKQNTSTVLVNNLISSIKKFIDKAPNSIYKKIIAIGIAIPGIVNFNESIYSPLLNWMNLPLKGTIENALGIPTFLENIARVKSIYETRHIDKEKDKNIIYISLSPGIGMVNFFDSKMIKGKHSIAGEIGHMTLEPDGPKCYCGNRGCFELYCGEDNILKNAEELILKGKSPILASIIDNDLENLDLKSLYEAQEKGDIEIHTLLTTAGKYLGCALANIANSFDPDRLIISGGIIEKGDLVYNCAVEEMRKRLFDIYSRDIKVEKPVLKSQEIIKAIAAFTLSKIVDQMISGDI